MSRASTSERNLTGDGWADVAFKERPEETAFIWLGGHWRDARGRAKKNLNCRFQHEAQDGRGAIDILKA